MSYPTEGLQGGEGQGCVWAGVWGSLCSQCLQGVEALLRAPTLLRVVSAGGLEMESQNGLSW